MWNLNPIKNYPKPPPDVEWAKNVLSDPKLVRDCQRPQRFYDYPFMHQYAAALPDKSDAQEGADIGGASGASFDQSIALMKVAGEAAERHCLTKYSEVQLSYGTFADEAPALDPDHFQFYSPAQLASPLLRGFRWSNDDKFNWVAGEELVCGEAVRVPAQLLYLPFSPSDARPEPLMVMGTTTGAACGQSPESSSLTGMLEILERDAFMIHYLSRTEGMRIDLRSSELFSEITEYLKKFKFTLHTYLLQTDFPVCTVLALVIDESRRGVPGPWFSAGLKCSGDPARAVLGSIEEALQTGPWLRRVMQEVHLGTKDLKEEVAKDTIMDRAFYWSRPERAPDLSFLTRSRRVIPYDEIDPLGPITRDRHFNILLDHCREEGHPVYRVDVTIPEVREHGLTVSKIVMPTLQQFYLVEPQIPLASARWKTVPLRMGLADCNITSPNPVPHFFL